MLDQRTGPVPTAREARKRVRSSSVNRKPLTARVSELVYALMYVGMLTGLLVGAARVGFERAAAADAAARVAAAPVAGVVRWAVLLGTVLLVAAVGKVALSLGPVLVPAPALTWLLSSPIDRRALLVGRFAIIVALGAVTGVLVSLLAMLASLGSGDGLLAPLSVGAVLGAAFVSVTVLIQGSGVVRLAQRMLSGTLGAGVGALIAVLIIRPGAAPAVGELVRGEHSTVTVATASAVALIAGGLALVSLGRLRRVHLSAGVEVAEVAATAAAFLDPTLLWGTLLVRRTRRIARVRSARFTGSRLAVLVRADLVRARRMWAGTAVWFGLLPVPYLAAATIPAALLPAIHLATALLATGRLAGGLRIVGRSQALRRSLGGSDRQLLAAHLVLPAVGAVLWCAATAAALPHRAVLGCAVSAIGAVLVCYLKASRKPLDYSGPTVDVGFGSAVPVWLVLQLSRGPAVLLILLWIQTSIAG